MPGDPDYDPAHPRGYRLIDADSNGEMTIHRSYRFNAYFPGSDLAIQRVIEITESMSADERAARSREAWGLGSEE
jgi:hypothetical protein